MVIASGSNLYPRDVEEVQYEPPAVLECCVAGVADQYRSETVTAFIVKRPGAAVTNAGVAAVSSAELDA